VCVFVVLYARKSKSFMSRQALVADYGCPESDLYLQAVTRFGREGFRDCHHPVWPSTPGPTPQERLPIASHQLMRLLPVVLE